MSRTFARTFVLPACVVLSAVVVPGVQAVKNPHAAQLVSVKAEVAKKPQAPASLPMTAPPGSILYAARRGDTFVSVARHHLKETKYLTSSELVEAIHEANPDHKSAILRAGDTLIIPQSWF